MKVVVVVAVVVVLPVACGRSEVTLSGNAEQSRVQTPDSPVVPSTPPPPATPPPKATVELPTKGFKLMDVLGKTKRDADRVLGHGEQLEDGPWLYDGFGKVAVLVVFETGRAVYVSVAAPEFHNTQADRAAVLAWMQASDGVDIDHNRKLTSEVGVWAPGAQDRQLARRELAERVSEGLKASAEGFASANYTWMEVTLSNPDTCTRAVLGRIARTYGLKNAGFEVMECVNAADTKLALR